MPAQRRKTTGASASQGRNPRRKAARKTTTARKTAARTTRPRKAAPKKTHDQIRKALWRRKRLLSGLCADCGQRRRLNGITRCAPCALKKRRLNRAIRECGVWKAGGQGAPPKYTDKELRLLVKKQKKS